MPAAPARPNRDPRHHVLWPVFGDVGTGRERDVALLGPHLRLTYGELAACLGRGGREIDGRFPPGARILIAAYDQMVVALAFLAALCSRAVPLLVDPQSPDGLARIARRFGAAGAVGDPGSARSIDGVDSIDGGEVLAWARAPHGHLGDLPPVLADSPAFWTFTSGTTGGPRAVVHAHRAPGAAFRAFAEGVYGLERDDRTVSTAGLPFVYALGNNLLFPLIRGATAILPPDLLLPTVLAEIRRHSATILVSGPWSLEAMARLAGRSGRGEALRRLRVVLSAGEPLAEGVHAKWREAYGQAPIDNLGCTEMFSSFLSASPADACPGSLGRVVPGFEVRVDGAPPRPGCRGALAVRGASRAIGVSLDDSTDRIAPPGGEWCEPGDEVEVDREGRFFYLGRLDDRFKVRGQFVRPAEVERRLRGLEGVQDCLVGLGTDERDLPCVDIGVVVDPACDPAEVMSRVRVEVRAALPAVARATRLRAVDALPRSVRGKLMRQKRAAP